MAKIADVKLGWIKSPSADVHHAQVVTTINGSETTVEVGPEVEEIQIEVQASSSVQFRVVTFDNEGNQSTSEVYSFSLGDLEAPVPASNLFHQGLAVREV
jgi:hypothetical protein